VHSDRRQHFQHRLQHSWVFVRLSKGSYHSKFFSRFLHLLINLPRLGVWRNTSAASCGRVSVTQGEKKHRVSRICVPRITYSGRCTNPGVRAPGQLKFVRRRLMCVGPQCGTCWRHTCGSYSFEAYTKSEACCHRRRNLATNNGEGENRPSVLGDKLERGEDWYVPVLNIHTPPSPTLIPIFICPSSTQ
jgi:hypothetical protein